MRKRAALSRVSLQLSYPGKCVKGNLRDHSALLLSSFSSPSFFEFFFNARPHRENQTQNSLSASTKLLHATLLRTGVSPLGSSFVRIDVELSLESTCLCMSIHVW